MSCNLLTKCRTCLSDSHIFHQLYDYVDENYKILEMLDGIVPQIDIKTSSNYSSLVCQSCVDKLLASYKFQQLCIETNKHLHYLMSLSLFEAVPKSEKILDPLTEASFKTKVDVEDDAYFECQINPEELMETCDTDNDVGPGHNTDNDTDSRFALLSYLRSHMITHTRQKPHKCKICDRAYKSSVALTKHLRTHVGENLHMCDECPLTFKKHFELKHRSEHHKMAKKLAQLHQPIHNHNQQIIIADQNHHITIENFKSSANISGGSP